ncbi:hypothetical protein K443DRAFT_122798 [Laccaria amethystina LaAM-08-1]|uniref:Uncharacterized protein n=1 Tax=Laccaria amethystina LaAM-08-1 TaxID=1095629 RepID=A0A0C9XG14_9AGAR|nr:hypothetical protein K443DRAFT_122798 [Laccaria amethystina LaAM-08-1]
MSQNPFRSDGPGMDSKPRGNSGSREGLEWGREGKAGEMTNWVEDRLESGGVKRIIGVKQEQERRPLVANGGNQDGRRAGFDDEQDFSRRGFHVENLLLASQKYEKTFLTFEGVKQDWQGHSTNILECMRIRTLKYLELLIVSAPMAGRTNHLGDG